jgi:hypothetical protein
VNKLKIIINMMETNKFEELLKKQHKLYEMLKKQFESEKELEQFMSANGLKIITQDNMSPMNKSRFNSIETSPSTRSRSFTANYDLTNISIKNKTGMKDSQLGKMLLNSPKIKRAKEDYYIKKLEANVYKLQLIVK